MRRAWIEWAKEQPNPKPHWLREWTELSEAEREVDRRIGERVCIMVGIFGWDGAPVTEGEYRYPERETEDREDYSSGESAPYLMEIGARVS